MFHIFALPLHALKTFGQFMFVPGNVQLYWWEQRGKAEQIKY